MMLMMMVVVLRRGVSMDRITFRDAIDRGDLQKPISIGFPFPNPGALEKDQRLSSDLDRASGTRDH